MGLRLPARARHKAADPIHHGVVGERYRHPAGGGAAPPAEAHGLPSVAPFPHAGLDEPRPPVHAGKVPAGGVHERDATVIAEPRRIEERHDVRVPVDEVRAHVEARAVGRVAHGDPALHDAGGVRRRAAAQRVSIRQRARPRGEVAVGHPRGEPAVVGGPERGLSREGRREEQREDGPAEAGHAANIGAKNEAGPGDPGPDRLDGRNAAQTLRTFCACNPLGPWATSNSTVSPSARLRKPSAWIAVKWTNTSGPDSCAMKPKPFASLNHFTLPLAITRQTSELWGTAPGKNDSGHRDQRRAQTKTARQVWSSRCADKPVTVPCHILLEPGPKLESGAGPVNSGQRLSGRHSEACRGAQ